MCCVFELPYWNESHSSKSFNAKCVKGSLLCSSTCSSKITSMNVKICASVTHGLVIWLVSLILKPRFKNNNTSIENIRLASLQTLCKHLQKIPLEHIVWAQAYRRVFHVQLWICNKRVKVGLIEQKWLSEKEAVPWHAGLTNGLRCSVNYYLHHMPEKTVCWTEEMVAYESGNSKSVQAGKLTTHSQYNKQTIWVLQNPGGKIQ